MTPSSGVSYGGGAGGAGVKTRGSDMVEVASATVLCALTSVLTSTQKLMPYPIVPVVIQFSMSSIRIPLMSSIGSVCG